MTPMIPERVILTAAPAASGPADTSIASGQGSFADILQQQDHQGDERVPDAAAEGAHVGHGADVEKRVVSADKGVQPGVVKATLGKPADDDMDGSRPADSGASGAIAAVAIRVASGRAPEGEPEAAAGTVESSAQIGYETDVSSEATADDIGLWLQQANILAPIPTEPVPAAGPATVSTRQEVAAGVSADARASSDAPSLLSAARASSDAPSLLSAAGASGDAPSLLSAAGASDDAPSLLSAAGASDDAPPVLSAAGANGDTPTVLSALGVQRVTDTGTGLVPHGERGEDGFFPVDEDGSSPALSRRQPGANGGRLSEPDGGGPATPALVFAQRSPEDQDDSAAVVMSATDKAKPDRSGEVSSRTESATGALQAGVPPTTTAGSGAAADPGLVAVAREVTMNASAAVRPGVIEATTSGAEDRGVLQQRSLDLASSATPGRITEQVQMLISQDKHQLELKLHPSELGHLHIKLQLQQDQAQVHFMVQNGQAREALEQALPRLREMLADAGIQLGQSGVEQQRHEQQSGGGRGQHAAQRAGNGERAAKDLTGEDGWRTTGRVTQVPAGRAGRVDYFA